MLKHVEQTRKTMPVNMGLCTQLKQVANFRIDGFLLSRSLILNIRMIQEDICYSPLPSAQGESWQPDHSSFSENKQKKLYLQNQKKNATPKNYFKEFNAEGKLSKVELLLETN